MQQSLGLFFKNTLLTGGGGVRGFLGQRGLTPFVDGRVRGSNVSTFSGGGPTNVLDSRVYHHGGAFSGHLRFGCMQLSFPLVSGRGVHTGGDLTVSTVAARGSSNVLKVYSHPNQFIKKAEKYQRDGDYVRSSKNCWKAYAMVVKLLYKDLKINIQSHDTFHELSSFAIDFIGSGPDAVILGYNNAMMEEARENKGEATYNDIDEYIEGAEKFVELFAKIDEKRVWNGLAPYLPTQPGPEHAIIFNGVKFEMKKHSDVIFGKWFNFLYEASDPEKKMDPHVYQHAVSFENYNQGSSTLPQFQHYASLSPLPIRHLNINGKDCTIFCDDNQYRVLCDKLNITFVSETPKKVHCHPSHFIKKAEEYKRSTDCIRSSKNCWKAYALVVKLLYKNLKINVHPHDTLYKLSSLAIGFGDSPNAALLGYINAMMEEARENKGEATYDDIQDFIEGAEKFVELFVKIDEKRVWNGLAPYLPTQPGPEHAIIFNGVKFEMRKHSDAIFGKWFNFLYEASDPEKKMDPHVYHHAGSFENYNQGSSTLPQFQQYASFSPLPIRHLNINGKDCTIFCDDNQYRVLCDKLNITFVSETPKKVYSHPSQFIKKAEEYKRSTDCIRSSKNCWKAYALVVKLLYKDLKINVHPHDTLYKLSLFAADCSPDAALLGYITEMMNEARENKGEATYDDIDEYIEGAEKFVELFGKIDEKRVWNGLAPYLPTQPGPEHAIIFNGVKFEMRKHSDAIFGEWFNFLYEASDPENEE